MRLVSKILNENTQVETERSSRALESILGSLEREMAFESLPIAAQEDKWSIAQDPERLVRSFQFENFSKLRFFLNESLEYMNETQHHGKITIDNNIIYVEAYTHDVNSVTELDKKLAKFLDEVYDDVLYIGEIRDEERY